MAELFKLNAPALAKALVDRRLRHGQRVATITETRHFPKSDTEKPLYRTLLTLTPGGVYTPRQYNSILCHVLAMGGGCVSLRSIEIDGAAFAGPGRVTEALGLTTPKATGRMRELKNGDLVLEMTAPIVKPKKATRPPRPPRVRKLSEDVLQRHMEALTVRWQRMKPRPNFRTYLESVIRQCPTEGALRRHLREATNAKNA